MTEPEYLDLFINYLDDNGVMVLSTAAKKTVPSFALKELIEQFVRDNPRPTKERT